MGTALTCPDCGALIVRERVEGLDYCPECERVVEGAAVEVCAECLGDGYLVLAGSGTYESRMLPDGTAVSVTVVPPTRVPCDSCGGRS